MNECVKFSSYQNDIFNFVEHGVGNLVIEAVAGSGKTTTLIEILKRIPQNKKILFTAFNTDIVNTIKEKIKKNDLDKNLNIDIRTINSLGYVMILRNFNTEKIIVNEKKYINYLTKEVDTLSDNNFSKIINKIQYIENVIKISNLIRHNLSESNKEINELLFKYNIELIGNEIVTAKNLLKWGKQNYNEIDYVDMIWLPNVLYLKPIGAKFDYILCDEAQDLSVAQKEILLKCQRMGSRYVFCGDANQCIYSFISSSPESFNMIKKIPNTTTLPLSVSYRCGKNIVKLAQTIVPNIQYYDLNTDGEIIYNADLLNINKGDMVLCRNNAPLIKIYEKLKQLNKICYINGLDLKNNLINIISHCNEVYLNQSLNEKGLFSQIYLEFFDYIEKLKNAYNLDDKMVYSLPSIINKLDLIQTLEFLSENINTSKELLEKIENIFIENKNQSNDSILLSTIHKSKGLECDNVYIAYPSLMSTKNITQDWEKNQELNLTYVAYTRAKHKLFFLTEDENIKKHISNIENTIKEKKEILNKLYNK